MLGMKEITRDMDPEKSNGLEEHWENWTVSRLCQVTKIEQLGRSLMPFVQRKTIHGMENIIPLKQWSTLPERCLGNSKFYRALEAATGEQGVVAKVRNFPIRPAGPIF